MIKLKNIQNKVEKSLKPISIHKIKKLSQSFSLLETKLSLLKVKSLFYTESKALSHTHKGNQILEILTAGIIITLLIKTNCVL